MEATPSSAGNSPSNGLAESSVKSAKLLLRKTIEDKQNYAETLCWFNQSPRSNGFSPSELFHGRRVRSHLPSLDDSINIEEGKAAREKTDLIVKSKHQVSTPQLPLEVGSLCYRIQLDGKKQTLVDRPCEVVSIRKHGESYYIRDIQTNRIYLHNRKYIKRSESSVNSQHILENMKVTFNTEIKHQLDNCQQEPEGWNVSTTTTSPPTSCMKGREHDRNNKRVHFDGSLFAAHAELKRFRMSS